MYAHTVDVAIDLVPLCKQTCLIESERPVFVIQCIYSTAALSLSVYIQLRSTTLLYVVL